MLLVDLLLSDQMRAEEQSPRIVYVLQMLNKPLLTTYEPERRNLLLHVKALAVCC